MKSLLTLWLCLVIWTGVCLALGGCSGFDTSVAVSYGDSQGRTFGTTWTVTPSMSAKAPSGDISPD